MKAVLLDKSNKVLEKCGVADMLEKIKTKKAVDKVVFDGIVTQRLVDLAKDKKISVLAGLKKAAIKPTRAVKVYTAP